MRKHSKIETKSKPAEHLKIAGARRWIGIDVGDRMSEICVLDRNGHVVERLRVRTTQQGFSELSRFAGSNVAIETGTHCAWIARVLGDCGLDVTVANARELRKIYQSDRKNDRTDAEVLARMVRFDRALLAPVRVRTQQMQADRSILNARDALVGARTKFINVARGLAKCYGTRLPSCSAESFVRQAIPHICADLAPALEPLLKAIAAVNEQIRIMDKHVESLAKTRYPQCALLRQVEGVGPLTAMAFILTLGDNRRFRRARDVGPYLGLVPRQFDSGQRTSQLAISKAGNKYMRRLLVSAAQYILGPFAPDSTLRRYGERISERGGANAKKRAVVAVARKLAVLLYHLWATAEAYEPLHYNRSARAA